MKRCIFVEKQFLRPSALSRRGHGDVGNDGDGDDYDDDGDGDDGDDDDDDDVGGVGMVAICQENLGQ